MEIQKRLSKPGKSKTSQKIKQKLEEI